ncbi:MAG: anion permease [Candidatus Micrarchaeales archaeon]|nr:anion permease [Candidatus Micrarchaeales archaeon]
MLVPIIILLVIFVLIAVRHLGRLRLKIWQIMLGGAVAVLALGQISPTAALESENFSILLLLFGMFIIGEALEQSGYLMHFSSRILRRVRSVDALVLAILFGIGLSSALLLNDNLAIIGTPLMLYLAKAQKLNPQLLLLSLAFAITIGSVMSPIGNPQNVLIALNSGISNPFYTFLGFLLIPTIINLFIAYLILRLFYRNSFKKRIRRQYDSLIKDRNLATLSKISMAMLIILIVFQSAAYALGIQTGLNLTYIVLISALPIVLFSGKRKEVVKGVDWRTLIFFAALFVVVGSAVQSGSLQFILSHINTSITSIPAILSISVVASQFISNVPLVAVYLPLLLKSGVTAAGLIALVAGSTIAGNLTILGAASNVIIIQTAERKSKHTVTFWQFIRIGIPLTLINILVYWIFLSFL